MKTLSIGNLIIGLLLICDANGWFKVPAEALVVIGAAWNISVGISTSAKAIALSKQQDSGPNIQSL